MGEYLSIGKNQYKLGTCEDLYYTRYKEFKESRFHFEGDVQGFLKPDTYRFRFPFPDEDSQFSRFPICQELSNFNRGFMLRIPKRYKVEIGHSHFFTRHEKNGVVFGFDTDCPMKDGAKGKYFLWENKEYQFLEVVQQKPVMENGVLQLQVVCRCPICESASRLNLEEVLEIERWANETDQDDETKEIVRRMKAGYFPE